EKRVEILGLELDALLAREAGDAEAEIGFLRKATTIEASMPYAFGPPFIDKPPYELLGEELLAQKRPKEAIAALETAIKRTPRRTAPLLALARAQKAAGESAAAEVTYKELRSIWKHAEPRKD
ncbi:MAG TPA: tetratricopeptide repeat protein, partial [Thermoanaerobaculia bacterium]|nr:tetratricopeptide repeat protein [Thermoanaerobaculia bacterium]